MVTTDQASYQEGAAVVLTIQNQEAGPVAYNACTRDLEVGLGSEWTAGPASLRLCTREVSYVAAGTTRVDSTSLDLGLPAGKYRIVVGFTRDEPTDETPIRAATNSFMIVP